MSQDHYDLLGIPENANDIWIRRAYDQKRKALDEDGALAAEEKQRRLVLLEKAFNVLSNPAARERYDNRTAEVVAAKAPGVGRGTLWLLAAAVIVVLVSSAVYWQNLKMQERRRIEQEQAMVEQAAKEREAAEQLRLEQLAAKRKEMQEAQDAINQRIYEEQVSKRYIGEASDAEKARALNDKKLAEARARQEQSEQLREQYRAQQDLQRQKQFLQQSEREREYAAAIQRQQAAQEQYRQQVEEQRRNQPTAPR